jgi:hypothetical protein
MNMNTTKQALIIGAIMVAAALFGAARLADENWLKFTQWSALFMAIQMPGLWLLLRESRRLS